MSITSFYLERHPHEQRARHTPIAIYEEPVSTAAPTRERDDLLATIARLRSFAMLLCLDAGLADHLVETTLVRASIAMSPDRLGANTLAWLCARLRGYYYGDHAAAKAEDGAATPPSLAEFEGAGHDSVVAALAELPAEQREALVLTRAAGFSVREAARICSCPLYLFKARIEAGRAYLGLSLSVEPLATVGRDLAHAARSASHLHFVAVAG